MKHICSVLLFSMISAFAFGQGVITSLTVFPSNPTSTDTVFVYAELSFSSGDCELDNQFHNVSGNSILASAHHCLGLATVICGMTDTFKIDPLPAGTYSFDLTLTSGMAPAPCTPGIIADDDQNTSFIVSPSVGINETSVSTFHIVENPVNGVLRFSKPLENNAELLSVNGQIIRSIAKGALELSVAEIEAGAYFLRSGSVVIKVILK